MSAANRTPRSSISPMASGPSAYTQTMPSSPRSAGTSSHPGHDWHEKLDGEDCEWSFEDHDNAIQEGSHLTVRVRKSMPTVEQLIDDLYEANYY